MKKPLYKIQLQERHSDWIVHFYIRDNEKWEYYNDKTIADFNDFMPLMRDVYGDTIASTEFHFSWAASDWGINYSSPPIVFYAKLTVQRCDMPTLSNYISKLGSAFYD